MIQEIVKEFTKRFPLSEGLTNWDNMGILISSKNNNKNILLTIDLTDEVLDECLNKNIQNVISYHPVIFKGFKSINSEEVVYKCILNSIAVYCPHTSLDKLMNEYLLKQIKISLNDQDFSFSFDSLACIGKINNNISQIADVVKKLLNLEKVRIAYPQNKEFIPENVLVGVGAGFTYVNVTNSLVITGEMRHHEILHAVKYGNVVILVEHSNGERFYLSELRNICAQLLPDFNIFISQKDKDPIEII
ncbi:YbgI/family dinuclear metal center protein [Anncaliia algerae PRA339]|uniref:YbgI/family dinuclear metal center protein n=1 Tax=Anncaliia algerae PRA339 TaxID=1288291 RepID=A0A059F2S0_9MICR|nr:YbgI/family dinuclear metal center protein [Anncaliia algerae PRA339]